jgi:hypothetical protein
MKNCSVGGNAGASRHKGLLQGHHTEGSGVTGTLAGRLALPGAGDKPQLEPWSDLCTLFPASLDACHFDLELADTVRHTDITSDL